MKENHYLCRKINVKLTKLTYIRTKQKKAKSSERTYFLENCRSELLSITVRSHHRSEPGWWENSGRGRFWRFDPGRMRMRCKTQNSLNSAACNEGRSSRYLWTPATGRRSESFLFIGHDGFVNQVGAGWPCHCSTAACAQDPFLSSPSP